MQVLSTSGLLSAAHTLSREAGMRWLSFICMFILDFACLNQISRALPAPPRDGDLGQDRHRDLLGRDGAKIEPGRRLDAIDRGSLKACVDQFVAQRSHLATAADKGVIGR